MVRIIRRVASNHRIEERFWSSGLELGRRLRLHSHEFSIRG